MEKMKLLAISVSALLFLLVFKTDGQLLRPVTPLPLCASQFALANYACARLPPSPPAPIPSPPSPPPDDDDGDNSHHHGHKRERHRRRRHHHIRELTPAEENCCRWARDVDNDCVCDVLGRLPDFLSRAVHQYVVGVGESCQITYSCRGRIKI